MHVFKILENFVVNILLLIYYKGQLFKIMPYSWSFRYTSFKKRFLSDGVVFCLVNQCLKI